MIIEFLADGFEEVEALTPLDMLRRAGADIKTVSIKDDKRVTGAHGVTVIADEAVSYAENAEDIEAVILPGGMPGAKNLYECETVLETVKNVLKREDGRAAAICAAPFILGRLGLLKGKRATCYPGFEGELEGAICEKIVSGGTVVTDGQITTASGMGVAVPFGAELIRLKYGREKAGEILRSILY